MGILLYKDTPVAVLGVTGREGGFHTKRMLEYGTNITFGVNYKPHDRRDVIDFNGKKLPVYQNLGEGLENYRATLAVVYVPAGVPKYNMYARNAIEEALVTDVNGNTIETVVVITEFIPENETMILVDKAKKLGKKTIGPNCPGIITPGEAYVGVIPASQKYFKPGYLGVVSRSGTLCYELSREFEKCGYGQSTVASLGGDAVIGTGFVDYLELFRYDKKTRAVVLIGEIGGNQEQQTAEYIKKSGYEKPVFAFIAGRTAKEGKRFGHAGAIILGDSGTWENKVTTLEDAGVPVFRDMNSIGRILEEELG